MRLPDGTTLMHGVAPYDPQKAHEYYLRTRELKGRKPGRGQDPMGSHTTRAARAAVSKTTAVKPTPQVLAAQKKAADERVASIKGKLAALNAKLKVKMAAAREAERKEKAGPTAAEKSKKAKESKKYRDKHKQELKTAAKKAGKKEAAKKGGSEPTVDELKTKIAEVKGQLAAAVERQRQLTKAT